MNLMVQINIIMYQKNKEDGSTNIAEPTFSWSIVIVHLLSIASMIIQRRGPPINMAAIPKIAIPKSANIT